jgi:general secretion pathway protein E
MKAGKRENCARNKFSVIRQHQRDLLDFQQSRSYGNQASRPTTRYAHLTVSPPPPEKDSGSNSSSVIRALDQLIQDAVTARASDIHLEPERERTRIRFRIDGVMTERSHLSAQIGGNVCRRVKVLGRMDISETRQPQDGTFQVQVGTGSASLRASTFPCVHGEKLVMRLLQANSLISLEKLGMGRGQLNTLRSLFSRPDGLLLVTGPTGSGKTSTLYAMLNEMETTKLNIVTLEDPIEVQLNQITQGQVQPRAGFTFASGLRAILRQDPDVILVGEMRDPETAAIAVQASLTGHLVLSTMHTNSTIATITRLIDLGLEPYIVANALLGVVSQRLIRMLCPDCREEYPFQPSGNMEEDFGIESGTPLFRPKGCRTCMMSGFTGRRGIYEAVIIDDDLRGLIKRKADPQDYKAVLKAQGIPTLRQVGMRQVRKGRTSASEVLRVT